MKNRADKRNVTLAEQVLNQIIRRLAAQALPLGSKLPTEKEISEELNVGRSSVREAIKTLNALGLVRSTAGSGSYLEQTNVYGKLALFASLLNGQDRQEMIDLRASIELYALLQFHRDLHRDHSTFSQEYIQNIEKTLGELTQTVKSMFESASKADFVALEREDFEFHQCILHYPQNGLIIDLFHNLEQFMHEEIKDSYYKVPAKEVARNHQSLLEAIKNPNLGDLIRNFEFHMNDTKNKVMRASHNH